MSLHPHTSFQEGISGAPSGSLGSGQGLEYLNGCFIGAGTSPGAGEGHFRHLLGAPCVSHNFHSHPHGIDLCFTPGGAVGTAPRGSSFSLTFEGPGGVSPSPLAQCVCYREGASPFQWSPAPRLEMQPQKCHFHCLGLLDVPPPPLPVLPLLFQASLSAPLSC